MIELPEAVTIAGQITRELKGKRIKVASRGNSPHKFAFYSGEPEEYESILPGKTIGEARDRGTAILVPTEPEYLVILGGGGERILFHPNADTLPKKHHFMLQFTDDTYLSVSIQGWGSAQLTHESELGTRLFCGGGGPSPLSDEFTEEYFLGLFGELKEGDPSSVKYFSISKPGVLGIGNGCLQDILFRAGLHPRKRAVETSIEDRRAFYRAIRETTREVTDLGGRDCERDLYNRPGGYQRILHSKVVGQPCPECGVPIDKISYLGGASYFCPRCQPPCV